MPPIDKPLMKMCLQRFSSSCTPASTESIQSCAVVLAMAVGVWPWRLTPSVVQPSVWCRYSPSGFMQEAVPVGQGAMAAILGLDFAAVDQPTQEALQLVVQRRVQVTAEDALQGLGGERVHGGLPAGPK